ncbi:MAG: flavodoxin-dependent (E)-4-hydroxy-3-methylbut-2-enyl-diphosphate synthase, partial [Parachlamydia sp.]|nr:flavodoxin-dependent (E)-4-hydroxy-3-methylbut-2-enyl-diphosphate synthase [Parachlamydia sp.]
LVGCKGSAEAPKLTVSSADALLLLEPPQESHQKILSRFRDIGIGSFSSFAVDGTTRILPLKTAFEEARQRAQVERFTVKLGKGDAPIAVTIEDESPKEWDLLLQVKPALIFLKTSDNRVHYARRFFEWMHQQNIAAPVILNYAYPLSQEDLVIQASAESGALLCDGLGDGLCIESPHAIDFLRNFSFNILQAARMRTFKTDFISCPSCGRTLFNLQDVTKRISARTAHLPGVKIAIMGCIVNGPGEMSDADFGYVGSKPGMIDLYVGKTCVEKDIPFSQADDRLVELLKAHGRWQEPAMQ